MLEGLRTALATWIAPKQLEDVDNEAINSLLALVRSNPPTRGTTALMRAYREMPRLRAVVHRIAESVASVPWTLGVQTGPNGKAVRCRALQRGNHESRKRLRARLTKQGEIREIEEHPLLDLLENGNMMLSGHSVTQVSQSHMELKGEMFQALGRNPQGLPSSLWPMPPNWVEDTPRPNHPVYDLTIQGRKLTLPANDVIWVKDPDVADPYGRGSGTAESLGDELDSDEYASKFIASFFYNQAMPSAIVALKGASTDEVAAAREDWRQAHRGAKKGHVTRFTSMEIDVKEFGQSFKDSELVELKKFLRNTVNEVWGVPPEVMGIIENSNRATISAAFFLFAVLILVPRMERLRIAYQRQLVPEFDERLILDYVSPVPDDKAAELEAAKAAPWAITRAEWRGLAGFASHGEVDDVYLQGLNLFENPVKGLNGSARILQGIQRAALAELLPAGSAVETIDAPTPMSRRELLTGRKAATPQDVEFVLEDLRPQVLTNHTRNLWDSELAAWGQRTLDDLGVAVEFDMFNPLVVEHLREFSEFKIEGLVHETTKGQLRDTLVEGVQAGEGVPDLTKRVNVVFDEKEKWQARRIARTETLRSSNFATHQSHVVSGVVSERMWIAAFVDTRTEHEELDGETRAIDKPFEVGGDTAMFPGDFKDVALNANCSCTIIAIITVPEASTAAIEKQIQEQAAKDRRERVKWQRKAETAFKAGFEEQRRDMVEAVKRLA